MNLPWFVLFTGYFLYLPQRTHCKDIDCGSHYTSRTGSFSSPGYPKQYSSDLLCVWTVKVTGSNPEITLTFREFDLPPKSVDGECSDFLAVFSGTVPTKNELIGKYCGSGTPSSLQVKKQAVYIQFVSNDDQETGTGFVINFSTSSSSSSITTSQATAGIVAAIFCGIVFLGVGAMRCVMMGTCQRCQNETPENRECVGTHETVSNYVMDCPPSYRTVMEHPERFPTPNITPHISPTSTPRASHYCEQNQADDDDDSEPPPPYSRVIPPSQASVEQDIDTEGTRGSNVQQTYGVERIPVNDRNNVETVLVHSHPRNNVESNEAENERTSANRRRSYSIASLENPVSSTNSDSLEELNSDHNEKNRSNDRQLPRTTDVEPRNTSTRDSNGSLGIVDNNNEPIGNYDNEHDDTGCCSTTVQITEPQRNHYILGRRGSSLTHDHSTQTEVLNRGGNNVWL